jgi:hypothetical protein
MIGFKRTLVFVALLILIGATSSLRAQGNSSEAPVAGPLNMPGALDFGPPPTGRPDRPLRIAPAGLGFGRLQAGTFSAPKTVTIVNPNPNAISIGPITANSPFQQTNTCGTQIASRARCEVSVTFTSGVFPSAPVVSRAKVPATAENGALTITNGASSAPRIVRLHGVQLGTSIPTPTATATPTATPTPSAQMISGAVSGGANSISGATVTLYQMGSTGYGQGATSLGSALTDSNGTFTISYSQPAPSSMLYVVALGGDAGSGANSAIGLITVLGPANALPSSATINEVTTIATTWAMAQFIDPTGQNIGAPSSNVIGLANAVSAIISKNLIDVTTGLAPASFPPAVSSPTSKLYTIADVIAACVESSGAGSSQCTSLFGDATPSGGTTPATTLAAALDIARNAAHNAAALFALVAANAPFEPTLSSAPTDWTLALAFTGGGLSGPTAVAIDASGDVWIADYNSAVTELAPNGAAISPSNGFTGGGLFESFGIAIDQLGQVWVPDEQSPSNVNSGNGAITVLSSNGSILSGANGLIGGGLDFPQAVAIDSAGNAWIANFANASISEFSGAGSALSPSSGFTGGGLAFPVALGFDGGGNLWVSDQGADAVGEFAPDGGALSPAGGYTGGGLDGPFGLAIDQAGDIWVANYYGSDLAGLEGSAAMTPGTPFSPMDGFVGGGLDSPVGLAIDGVGNIWITNYRAMSVSEFAGANNAVPAGSPISGASGYNDASFASPYGIAIDSAGNVWVADNDASNGHAVTELLGAAAPVKTPLIGPAQLP